MRREKGNIIKILGLSGWWVSPYDELFEKIRIQFLVGFFW
jgi:hypothetical protein